MGLRYEHLEAIEKHAAQTRRADRGDGRDRRPGRAHTDLRPGALGEAGTGGPTLRCAAARRPRRLRARGLLPVPLADDPHAAFRGCSGTVRIPPSPTRSTTGRSSGARSALDRISRASAASTPTNGIGCTCCDRAISSPNRTCRTTRGSVSASSTVGTSRRGCACCAGSATRTPTRRSRMHRTR